MQKAVKNIIHWISRSSTTPRDPIQHYRERIFNLITFTFLVTALLALIPGVYASIKTQLYSIAVFDILAYALLIVIFWFRSIPLYMRKILLISLPYSLGIFLMFTMGPISPGFAYLVGFNILGSILLGYRTTIITLIITTITLLGITAIIYFGIFPNNPIQSYTALSFFAAGINMILIGSVSSLPLAYLVSNLEKKIHEQRILQDKLKKSIYDLDKAKIKAEESDKLKSSFLANMSHEIRTPLNAIIGFSDVILENPDIEEEERTLFLSNINESGNYLLNIIENILDISMIESNQLKVFIHEVNLNQLTQNIEQLYLTETTRKNKVSLDFSQKPKQEVIVNTDENRVKQVLVNLINNAIKFTPGGTIWVGFVLKPYQVEFFVKDNGKGIPESQLETIFQRFIKGQDNKDENIDGTGLGLPISKEIIKILGGDIRVESQIGKGTVFYFTLPLTPPPN